MFLLVDKPSGCTSFDVVEKIKRIYAGEKVGHGGTLDPMATGLLVVAIGKDTKQLDRLLWARKTYVTTIDFSKRSDTWDMDYRKEFEQLAVNDGKIQVNPGEQKDFPLRLEIETVLEQMLTTREFPLTPFSAKKVNGKKLYEYARAGEPIFLQTPMRVYTYTLIDYTFPTLTIQCTVGSGTYIRSLAHRLWEKIGMGWILTQLRRTAVGSLQLPQEA